MNQIHKTNKATDPKILADCYQLSISIFNRTKGFAKQFRPTLGRRLEERGLDLTLSIRLACWHTGGVKGKTRRQWVQEASALVDEIRLLLQMTKEMNLLGVVAFAELSEQTNQIGREIGGLLKCKPFLD